jgi:hypothetical protein
LENLDSLKKFDFQRDSRFLRPAAHLEILPLTVSHGRGRWFEPSIAYHEIQGLQGTLQPFLVG